jgi:hypothetical protein
MNPIRRASLSVLVVALLTSSAPAGPREELLRLVPEDVGFCVVLHDLRNHTERLTASPFLADLLASPLGNAVRAAPETKQLLELKQHLKKHLGVEWSELRDEVLGDALVLAYRPPTAQRPGTEQELVLVHARSPKLLARLLDRLNEAQKQSGELKEFGTYEHAGRKYHRRVEAKQEGFYYLHGPLLAVSSRESAIREVIEREGTAGKGESPVAKQFRLLGVEKAPAAMWLNPRAFEAEMEAKAAAAKGAEAAFLQTFLRCWNALDGVGVSAGLDREIEVALTVRSRPDALPESIRKALAAAKKPSALWSRVPDDAIFAAAGRFDLSAMLELIGEFATKEDRAALIDQLQRSLGAALGRDVVKDVLPYLGPDWGLCVTAPAGDGDLFPHTVLAVSVAPGPGDAPAGEAVFELLNSYAVAAVLNHNRTNKDAVALKRITLDKVEVKYLVNEQRFPPGLRPAFALAPGYLLLASSPEAIKAFLTAPASARPTAGEFPLARLSLKALRQFVERRRAPLSAAVAEKNGLTKDEAGRRLEALLLGLGLADRLELTQRGEPGRTTWTLRLRTTRPLAKNKP